jgi:hypothetical protein
MIPDTRYQMPDMGYEIRDSILYLQNQKTRIKDKQNGTSFEKLLKIP